MHLFRIYSSLLLSLQVYWFSLLTYSFYIHRKLSGFSDAIILVPTQQFQAFLANINHELDTQLTIPPGRNSAFEIIFEHDVGTPCPRYLGRSKSYDMVERMKKNIPPVSYRTQNEKGSQKIQPNDRSLEAFRLKVQLSTCSITTILHLGMAGLSIFIETNVVCY